MVNYEDAMNDKLVLEITGVLALLWDTGQEGELTTDCLPKCVLKSDLYLHCFPSTLQSSTNCRKANSLGCLLCSFTEDLIKSDLSPKPFVYLEILSEQIYIPYSCHKRCSAL